MSPDVSVPGYRLRPPPLPSRFVVRPRVNAAIMATAAGSACVLAAAPGYGVTTAVLQAMSASTDPVSWITLDPRVDDDTAMRLLYAALGDGPRDLSELLAGKDSMWVVVDGLDTQAHPTLTKALRDLHTGLPAHVRLIVTTHEDDVLPGAVVYTESLLAFDPDEALELLTLSLPDVDVDDASRVISAAQGWATALVAAAQIMRSRADTDWLWTSLPVDLFADWLANLPPQRREVLERTAVLDTLGEGPARQVTGRQDIGEVLEELQRHHCYIRACDPPAGHTGRWWERHPLLTAALTQHLGGDALQAHAAAARWYAQASDVRATMEHMLAAGHFAEAADFLTDHESRLLSTGLAPQVMQWYDRLAEAHEHEIDGLLRAAWGRAMARDIAAADSCFARLHAAVDDYSKEAERHGVGDERVRVWLGEVALLRAYLAAFRGDPDTVVASAREAAESPAMDAFRDLGQLAPLLVVRGLLWSGQPEGAARVLDSMDGAAGSNPVLRELQYSGCQALIACARGEIASAHRLVEQTWEWIESSGVDPLEIQVFTPVLAKAWVALEQGRLDDAEATAHGLRTAAESCGHISDATWACLILARSHLARGDYGAALRVLAQGRDLAMSRTPDSTLSVPLDQVKALVHIAAGDSLRAQRVISHLPPSSARVLLEGRAVLGQQPARSRRMVEGLETRCPREAAERHLLLAAMDQKTSRRLAQGHIRQAAAIAHDNDLRLLMVPPEAGLPELAAETAREYDDVHLIWLLEPLGTDEAPRVQTAGLPRLSRGELQLVALLPTRAKNVEIAEQFGVSVNTVKTRLRRLYSKLGVVNRDEAIAAAVQRGLLDAEVVRQRSSQG